MEAQPFNRIVALLTPHMEKTGDRDALITPAFSSYPVIYSKIDWTGSAREFTVRFAHQLERYGELESGYPALAHLLQALRPQVGVQGRNTIDLLLSELTTAPSPESAVKHPAKPNDPQRPLQVFLCHASGDKVEVRNLYQRLQQDGVQPWLDEEDLLPGQDWQLEIPQAVRESDVVLVALSHNALNADGYIQEEIRFALDAAESLAVGTIYIIPLKLEECAVPQELGRRQWADLSDKRGYERLIKALKRRAREVNAKAPNWTSGPYEFVKEPTVIHARQSKPSAVETDATPALPKPLPKLDTKIEFDWVEIPAGEFKMGSPEGQGYDDERPQHTIYLDTYHMARGPVTNRQYEQFVKATGHKMPQHWEDGKISNGKADHPVTYVTWYDALKFCEWAGVKLPTEAQWEKGARGVDGRVYPWGDEKPTEELCNFNMNVGDTTAVGKYPNGASPYDCLDMAGNVWEWTCSLWGTDRSKPDFGYPYVLDDGRENLKAERKVRRVLRGGSWYLNPLFVRAAVRGRLHPLSCNDHVGFRVLFS